ncbi:LPS export ABC transporter periplasmic protein LptC [Pedobacter rhodius]|uniref:LPS export ABC transporter periplasmic protein LptC n=1 Tax=Pedobacter rhodius TaxID=3004098 RepID=A0ABT4KZG8_9SPHI|nr:LPS export ABC transporter periplasmic protein LptC [Pedobacter sp. SJ11]MCZ4224330.1 LPS export ABC transporter periplasmic protein LptC [Pedobacter sp. SJ11]
MMQKAFLYGLMLMLPALLVSCGDDDLKKANPVGNQKVILNRDRTIGVEIIYSDSARVKAKGNAPIMDKVTTQSGSTYQEMIKGVKIDFFDVNQPGVVDGTLICDYAIRKEQEQKTFFRRNVIVKNAKGDTFSSEELIWDEAKKLFYSTQRVYIRDVNGENKGSGIDFQAPQDFSTYTLNTANGEFNQSPIAP